jgi:hypothetical protein
MRRQVSATEFRKIKHIEILFNQYRQHPEFFLSWIAKIIDKSKRGNVLYGIDTHRDFFPVQYPNGLVSTFPSDAPQPVELTYPDWIMDFSDLLRYGTRMMKILYYRDPSTKKTYISFVPDEINKADDAMAWKFHLTRAEYDRLHIEA